MRGALRTSRHAERNASHHGSCERNMNSLPECPRRLHPVQGGLTELIPAPGSTDYCLRTAPERKESEVSDTST